MSSASSPTREPSRVSSVRCCSSRTTNGNCSAATCLLSRCELSSTISPLGCPPWSTEHESNRAKTHDSYTTSGDTIPKLSDPLVPLKHTCAEAAPVTKHAPAVMAASSIERVNLIAIGAPPWCRQHDHYIP